MLAATATHLEAALGGAEEAGGLGLGEGRSLLLPGLLHQPHGLGELGLVDTAVVVSVHHAPTGRGKNHTVLL